MSTEGPYQIDFAGIKAQAAALDTEDSTPEIVAEPTPQAHPVGIEPVAAAPVSATPPSDAPDPDELDPETHGERFVKIKIDGEYQRKALKDVTASFSRQSDYTKKMQALAQQRTEVETQKATYDKALAEREQIQAFISHPQQLLAYLQKSAPQLFEQAHQPLQGNPDEIATVQNARDMVTAEVKRLREELQTINQSVDQRIAAENQKFEARQQTQTYATALNNTIREIFEANPILSAFPHAEDAIRVEVTKLAPQTEKEAHDAFRQVAAGIVEGLNEKFSIQNKTKVVQAAKLAKASIEPPGGSGPQIKPTTSFMKDGGRNIDFNKLRNAALNME